LGVHSYTLHSQSAVLPLVSYVGGELLEQSPGLPQVLWDLVMIVVTHITNLWNLNFHHLYFKFEMQPVCMVTSQLYWLHVHTRSWWSNSDHKLPIVWQLEAPYQFQYVVQCTACKMICYTCYCMHCW